MFGMTLNIDVPQLLWWVFASIALGSAILMVTRRNPIASLLFLVLTFFSLAALYVRLVLPTEIIEHGGALEIDTALREHNAVGAIAYPLFRDYLVPFEITSILLLVAIIGAVVLAKRKI